MIEPRRSNEDTALTTSLTRRDLFQQVSGGLYGAALTCLLGRDGLTGSNLFAAEDRAAQPSDLKPRKPHFEPKAKSVIHLFMNGGPSQMDLWDPKPFLDKHHGESYFDK